MVVDPLEVVLRELDRGKLASGQPLAQLQDAEVGDVVGVGHAG
jgi:hypothetical protein